MAPSPDTGRWVIVLGDNCAPVFWSIDRASLDAVCAHVRRTCPTARVVWHDGGGDGHTRKPRDNAAREVENGDAPNQE